MYTWINFAFSYRERSQEHANKENGRIRLEKDWRNRD